MENRFTTYLALLLCIGINLVHCEYSYTESSSHIQKLKEKVTHLHFYYFDIHTGPNASAIVVARANENDSTTSKSPSPFGTVYAIDNHLREGPEYTSNVIGNARGLYVSSAQLEHDKLTLVMYVDYAFTSGEFNGSSISVFSRNPVTEPTRELAVVGGRGKFRMARGFAEVKPHFLNFTTGDGILEYNVTVLHY